MKSARAQILRCGRKIGGPRAGCLLQMVEVLDDRKAEADQRHRGTLPRHLRAFDTVLTSNLSTHEAVCASDMTVVLC